MIEKMNKYSFILLSEEKESFLKSLQEIGLMDITRSSKAVDEASMALYDRSKLINNTIEALKKLGDFQKDSNWEHIKSEAKDYKVEDAVKSANDNISKLEELEKKLKELEKDEQILEIWGSYDKDKLKALEEFGYKIAFYAISHRAYKLEWEASYHIEKISENKSHIFFVRIFNKAEENNFPIPEALMPSMNKNEILAQKDKLTQELISVKAKLFALQQNIAAMQEDANLCLKDLDLYLASQAAIPEAENYISCFEGFAPSKLEKQVREALDKMGVYYISESAKVDDNPPIKLKNNAFTRMFSLLTDMYGRPNYNEFDPTPYLSVFFLLFFAMCMADTGYGIALIVIALLLSRKKEMKDIAALVATLGVGTSIVGFIMHTFFGADISKLTFLPQWSKAIMLTKPIAGFEAPMVIAILVGVFHICVAIIVKTIYATKNNGFINSLGVWGWTLLIVGGVIVGGLSLTEVISSSLTKYIIIAIAIISSIGIFLLNNIKRNPLINIAAGLWETYNTATGLLGDVLSYLRLYALGLAGSMLGQAFNQIAMMTLGDGGFGLKPQLILFAIIVIIGHTLNLAMCCLGAFVHPLRLNFLEFFKNSAYEGKGRTYKPISK